MALRIQTFDNIRGGNTLYKALTHPHAAAPGRALVAALAARPPTAIVDPLGAAEGFAEIFGLGGVELAGIYVQNVAQLGKEVLGFRTLPIDELADSGARSVLVAAFDAERLIGQLQSYLPAGAEVLSLDRMRIPEERLTNRRAYLDPLNFATNFALFRDTGTLHTRVVTVNYWAGYGSAEIACWLTLFDGNGEIIAEWCERAGNAMAALTIDSREVRARFKLGDFAGQLFIHVAGAAGHDVVKYALDTFGKSGLVADGALSCTHDANAWPSDRYAGLPAPAPGERVILWVQNSHPTPIPAGAIALNPMGEEKRAAIAEPIGPFASRAIDVAELLLGLAWPRQIEVRAGKHIVRPRYEVVADGWLHALFRYRHRDSGHAAETSFGAHVFNTLFIYRDEPQSYIGRPPGLSTRLFLRLGQAPYDTLCHLIYPASRPWSPESATEITLYDGSGAEIARTGLTIPCSGSRLLRYHALFDARARERAGASAYAIIRDATCRLFGYHGLLSRGGAFSFDHMFGF